MASVNKVILLGNVGQDPDIKRFDNGNMVANVSLATTETYKDRDGNRQSRTEWHRINFSGKNAETVERFVKKGSQIYVEGMLRTREYTNRDGETRKTTEISGFVLQLLGQKQQGDPAIQGARPLSQQQRTPIDDILDEDMPY